MMEAASGMSMNWQSTPMGMDLRWVRDVSMSVKSDRSSVIPVPSMTPASIIDIKFPLLTQFNVAGAQDPRIADPNTKNGNKEVSLDRIWSSLGIVAASADISSLSPSDDNVDESNT